MPRRCAVARLVFLLLILALVRVDDRHGVSAKTQVHHRCLHDHSQTLQRIARSAARLTVEHHAAFTPADVVHGFTSTGRLANETEVSRAGVDDGVEEGKPQRYRAGTPSLLAEVSPVSPATADDSRYGGHGRSGTPFRVHFDVTHLYNASDLCTTTRQRRADKLGDTVDCAAADVLSGWKRRFIVHRLLPLVAASVQQWLSVRVEDAAPDAATAGETVAGGHSATRVFVPQGVCGEHVTVPQTHSTGGVLNTDFIVYVMAAPLHDETTATSTSGATTSSSTSRTAAWATYCAVDGHTDRPLVAMMNIVPSSLTLTGEFDVTSEDVGAAAPRAASYESVMAPFASPQSSRGDGRGGAEGRQRRLLRDRVYAARQAMDAYHTEWTTQHLRALLHELIHTLGFAPPQLRRLSTVVPAPRPPGSPAASSAANITVVATPAVQAAVRRWLNCTDARAVPGAALERSGGEGTVGAHWERAQFRDDLMAGVLSPVAALSDMTLAFLDSLPYYRVNRIFAEVPWWGSGAGCAFGGGHCHALPRFSAFQGQRGGAAEDVEQRTRERYWCEAIAATAPGHVQCTADRRAIGVCFAQRRAVAADHRTASPPYEARAPAFESYGMSPLMEGCPVVEPYVNHACDGGAVAHADATLADAAYRAAVLGEERGFYLGPYSRCFASSDLRRARSGAANASSTTSRGTTSGLDVGAGGTQFLTSARCLQTRCVRGGLAVELRVGGVWLPCPADGSAAILSVPPASGFTGYVACEPAALYCAGAPQLLRHVTAPLEADGTATTAPSLFRVTAAFFMLWTPPPPLPPPPRRGPPPSPDAALPGTHAATFRSVLVTSDAALHAALQSDLSRRRARLQLSPLGAMLQQRRVIGATRLSGAAVAVFPREAAAGEESDAASGAPPRGWHALMSVDMDVVALDADEAAAVTRAWLWTARTTAASSAATGTKSDDGAAAGVPDEFAAVAAWLSRVTCAAAVANPAANASACVSARLFPVSDFVLPSSTESAAAHQCSSPGRGGAWRVTANGGPFLSVVGPLDGADFDGDEASLREAALLHLRLGLAGAAAGERTSTPAPPRDQHSRALCDVRDASLVSVLSEPGVMLSLVHDVGALLGVSTRWVRVRALRASPPHSSSSASAVPGTEAKGGGSTGDVCSSSSNNSSTCAAQSATAAAGGGVDVLVVVSLPAFDESTRARVRGARGTRSASSAASASPLTWSDVAAHARDVWRSLLHDAARGGAELHTQTLQDVNGRVGELLRVLCDPGSSAGAAAEPAGSAAAMCDFHGIVVRGVVAVLSPEPDTVPAPFSVEDTAELVEDRDRPRSGVPWTQRRLTTMATVPVTVGAIVWSVCVVVSVLCCLFVLR
ncbi:Leishmanolysin [Novymonas esmeraldas]|uniref:leishmanolysin n=1 Tax=Novymonas esmeraldas TaxID=1808958 RepID=A0AAW0ENL0_9TRYP